MPKVSVIIPIFNVEKYLEECLDSIINQTLADIEIICVDDGSSDCSSEILDKYALKDKRIQVFHNQNHGVAYSRNFGISKSKGEYFYFIDADDYIELDFLEKLYKKAKENDFDIVKGNFKVKTLDGNEIMTKEFDNIKNNLKECNV